MPQPNVFPSDPDEIGDFEAIPVAVGGPSPWVRLQIPGRDLMFQVGTTLDAARLAGKWLYRRIRARARLTRKGNGEIVGGFLEDLDLVPELETKAAG